MIRPQAERDAERAKHQPVVWYQGATYEVVVCDECSEWEDESIHVEHPCQVLLALDDADAVTQELATTKRILRLFFTSNRDQNGPISISDVGIELKCYIKAFNFGHGDFQWFRDFIMNGN